MGRMAKNKGKRGEREFAERLSNLLGEKQIVDPQANGSDIESIPGLAIEVKRQETLNIPGWWRQAERQADDGRIPVLAFRQNRKPWQICLPAYLLSLRAKSGYILVSEDVFSWWLLDYLDS